MKLLSLFFCICLTVQSALAQWTGTTDIYKTTTGKVGIGTTTPWSILDIRTPGAAANDQNAVNVQNPSSQANAAVQIQLSSGSASSSLIYAIRNNLTNGSSLLFWNTDAGAVMQPRMIVNDAGNVGIGTTSPNGRLTVVGQTQNDGVWVNGSGSKSNVALLNNMTGGGWNGLTQTGDNLLLFKGAYPDDPNSGGLVLATWSSNNAGMRITGTGNVLIGKGTQTNTNYKLDIAGSARADKLVINSNGADYVFDPGYRLLPLVRVADSIRANHHLPGIAPAGQMQKEGMDLGDNQTLLLAKVEELTLYLIRMEERVKRQQKKIERLEKLVRGRVVK